MNKKFVIVDAANLVHRAKHVAHRGDIDMRIGMALHITFNGLRKAWRDLGGDHIVFCLEGTSWRKHVYDDYKANRIVAKLKKTRRELEDDELFFEAFDDLNAFIKEKTNCTVLQCPIAEADDLIATWIDLHPASQHIIVSSDTDFIQLLSDRVEIYNPIANVRLTSDGIFDDKNNRLEFRLKSDGKIKVGGKNPSFKAERDDWIQFATFLKCIRGDKTDNIYPAYPGARIKGSKNKTGITEAWDDRDSGGFSWNNFMLQTWTDPDGVEHTVRDRYEINRMLIDLHEQPDDVKEEVIECIVKEVETERKSNVGIHFMKFCSKWDLKRISQYPDEFATMLNAHYNDHLLALEKRIEEVRSGSVDLLDWRDLN